MISTRDKMEFCVAMARHTPATVRDVLALMRYASAYLATPIEARKEKMLGRMREVCARLGIGVRPGFGGVFVIAGETEIRIPV